jgi:Nucleotidyltransferase of unknown function (DUF6036)
MFSQLTPDLWELALNQPQIDALDLERAIEEQISGVELDFRTRLLIRDGVAALRVSLGTAGVDRWLRQSPHGQAIQLLELSSLGPTGFPSLVHRIMQATKPETVEQLLRELGLSLTTPTRLVIGGSIALILANALVRRTEDIDVVDEVPAEIRGQHELLDNLAKRYGLHLTHFQSHYLPSGWEDRLQSLGTFGKLDVFLIDPCDIFLGKLFSIREKDRDDLRAMQRLFDKTELIERLRTTTATLRQEPNLREAAAKNWYILFGDAFPI